MKKIKNKKTIILLFAIFLLALITRFYAFKSSTYFGYDEARDAFISQAIYTQRDFKIVGPPASNQPGIFHGPLHWYLIGPLYLIGDGNPYIVSSVFRIINAFGVFFVFFLGERLFNKNVGLTAGILFALSFEQTQYAMFVGNPSCAVFAWMIITYGLLIFIKEKRDFGIPILFLGCALAVQFDFFLIYTFIFALINLLLYYKNLIKVKAKTWIYSALLVIFVLLTFIVSEIKYNFQTTKGVIAMLTKGYNLISASETKLSVYRKMLLDLFRYNILNASIILLIPLIIGIMGSLLKERKKDSIKIVFFWIFASILLLPFGIGEALYFNIGLGIGLIIAVSYLLIKLNIKSIILYLGCLLLIFISNISLIRTNNPRGLLTSIKPQPYMLLDDEISIIEKMYRLSDGRGFTIRVTGIPYGVQTVWAYLLNQYGLKRYGYLPYFETGNIDGFPGNLPEPVKGTTCWRFLIQEPTRGIPVNLIEDDLRIENDFSKIVTEDRYGDFVLQTRQALDKNCHNEKSI